MDAKPTPGPLMVAEAENAPKQYLIKSDWENREIGSFEDNYVNFSGYFGSYGPNVFAAAPELLALVKRYLKETPLGHQPHMIAAEAGAAIAKAEGGAS